ncbi:MAG: hypothetical protein ACR2HA_03325, partial [Nocardioides sp.]
MTTLVPLWWPVAVGGICLVTAAAATFRLRRDRGLPAVPRQVGLLTATGVLLVAATVLRQVSGPVDAPNTLAVLGGLVLLPLALALYPDDRPPPLWGWWSLAPVLATGLLSLLYPDTYAASGLGGLVVFLLLMVLLWWRHAHAAPDADSRSAILWIALGGGTATMLGALAGFAMPDAEVGPALVLSVVVVAAVACL